MLISIPNNFLLSRDAQVREAYDPLFVWEGMRISTSDDQELVVLRNDLTAFILIVPTVSPLNLILPEVFRESLRTALVEIGVPDLHNDRYLAAGEEVCFSWMVAGYERRKLEELVDQIGGRTIRELLRTLNDEETVVHSKPIIPRLAMIEALKRVRTQLVDARILEIEGAVSLDLTPSKAVRRSFIAPATFPFSQLHPIIQLLYGWSGEMEYAFKPYKDIPPEESETLHAVFLKHRRLTYTYGPNERWSFTVELDAIRRRGEGAPVRCSGGAYAAPWEEALGKRGYDKQRKALENQDQGTFSFMEEYEMKLVEIPFDRDAINRKMEARWGKVTEQ